MTVQINDMYIHTYVLKCVVMTPGNTILPYLANYILADKSTLLLSETTLIILYLNQCKRYSLMVSFLFSGIHVHLLIKVFRSLCVYTVCF